MAERGVGHSGRARRRTASRNVENKFVVFVVVVGHSGHRVKGQRHI